MDDCIFCKIVKGDIPSYKVYEDQSFIAFLDTRPLTRGNCLVIPKTHYRWTYDVPNFGEMFEVSKKVGLAAQKAFGAEWISFITLGFEVLHAHVRVVPRYKKDLHETLVNPDIFENFSKEEMQEIYEKIKLNI